MAKIITFLADGFEEIEALATVDILRRADIEVVTVSITDSIMVTSSHGVIIQADSIIKNASFENVDLLFLPGGQPGADNLNKSEIVKGIVLEFNNKGSYIAAICAAPIVLGGLGILKDRHATCYPGYENRLFGANVITEKVVVDGNIITGNGVGAAIKFALTIVSVFKGEKIAEELSKKMLIN